MTEWAIFQTLVKRLFFDPSAFAIVDTFFFPCLLLSTSWVACRDDANTRKADIHYINQSINFVISVRFVLLLFFCNVLSTNTFRVGSEIHSLGSSCMTFLTVLKICYYFQNPCSNTNHVERLNSSFNGCIICFRPQSLPRLVNGSNDDIDV